LTVGAVKPRRAPPTAGRCRPAAGAAPKEEEEEEDEDVDAAAEEEETGAPESVRLREIEGPAAAATAGLFTPPRVAFGRALVEPEAPPLPPPPASNGDLNGTRNALRARLDGGGMPPLAEWQ
jgi:hypothetical protein